MRYLSDMKTRTNPCEECFKKAGKVLLSAIVAFSFGFFGSGTQAYAAAKLKTPIIKNFSLTPGGGTYEPPTWVLNLPSVLCDMRQYGAYVQWKSVNRADGYQVVIIAKQLDSFTVKYPDFRGNGYNIPHNLPKDAVKYRKVTYKKGKTEILNQCFKGSQKTTTLTPSGPSKVSIPFAFRTKKTRKQFVVKVRAYKYNNKHKKKYSEWSRYPTDIYPKSVIFPV